MVIDRTSFMAALGALALGGAGGYLASESGAFHRAGPTFGATELQAPAPPASAAQASTRATPPVATAPEVPACDDSTGTAADCPSPGYSADEGVSCGILATRRCQDFKRTMKARVAEHAVACLNALTPAQRCDGDRVNLCAHLALMNACPEPEGSPGAAAVSSDELTASCASMVQRCDATGLAPPVRECRATVAGLNAFGRDQMASCMKSHCVDKGLIGCEAVVDAK
jgi:hypothetical protein